MYLDSTQLAAGSGATGVYAAPVPAGVHTFSVDCGTTGKSVPVRVYSPGDPLNNLRTQFSSFMAGLNIDTGS